MFKKLVATEPMSLVPSAEEELHRYAGEIILHEDVPSDDGEIIRRIGDADVALVSYTSRISCHVIESCPSVRYTDMCCSLYSEESASADTAYTKERGITVFRIRDCGDRGVVEYMLSELVHFPRGPGRSVFRGILVEITNLRVGIIGMDVPRGMIADTPKFMGTGVSYCSRSRKQDREDQGMTCKPLGELLDRSEAAFAYPNKNVILPHKKEFRQLGQGKLLFDTSIKPAFGPPALKAWLDQGSNYFICDTEGALRDSAGELLGHPGVFCVRISADRTEQAFDLLNKKVLDSIRTYLER